MKNNDKVSASPLFVTMKKAAELTGISKYRLREMKKEGKLPGVMCGNRYMVNIPAFLKSLETTERCGMDDEC